jgi:DNA-binding IclR family transcriptional regulator
MRGAPSRIILAHMTAQQIRKLYERQADAFAEANIGTSLPEVRASLRRIRERGFEVTSGEVTPGVTAMSAPVLDANGVVLGSLSLAIGQVGLSEARVHFVAERVAGAAEMVGRAISG